MYPIKIVPPISSADPKDAVEFINRIVRLEIALHANTSAVTCKALREELELEKRKLTDYFLATDPRRGVYVKGEHE